MRNLRILIRKVAYSRIGFPFYFRYYSLRNRLKLLTILKKGADLMEQLNGEDKITWQQRIDEVMKCKDNKDIPRVPSAGLIINNKLIMHNGTKVDPLSYCNYPMLKMLMLNKGVHEPQEEKIFQEVLNSLNPKNEKVMFELGSYWSFYSIWFKTIFPNSKCYMIEPELINLSYGKLNFRINNFKGTFINSFIGIETNKKINIISIDQFCSERKINFIDILHSDIQGSELEMLQGCRRMLSENRVGYFFISTHSNGLHYSCLNFLKNEYNFSLVASADLNESFSWDGVLVMKSHHYMGKEKIEISKNHIE